MYATDHLSMGQPGRDGRLAAAENETTCAKLPRLTTARRASGPGNALAHRHAIPALILGTLTQASLWQWPTSTLLARGAVHRARSCPTTQPTTLRVTFRPIGASVAQVRVRVRIWSHMLKPHRKSRLGNAATGSVSRPHPTWTTRRPIPPPGKGSSPRPGLSMCGYKRRLVLSAM